jgi:hypothetical protein
MPSIIQEFTVGLGLESFLVSFILGNSDHYQLDNFHQDLMHLDYLVYSTSIGVKQPTETTKFQFTQVLVKLYRQAIIKCLTKEQITPREVFACHLY